MARNPLTGLRIRWTFQDGPTAGTMYEHRFMANGTVRWNEAGDRPTRSSTAKVNVVPIRPGVVAVAYLAESGYTLTSILDTDAGLVVAFASNESGLVVQHGTFDVEDLRPARGLGRSSTTAPRSLRLRRPAAGTRTRRDQPRPRIRRAA